MVEMGHYLTDIRENPGDLWLAASVGVILAIVYQLPKLVRLDLALDHQAPTLLTAYASHFVHLRGAHLLTNLVVFGLLFSLCLSLASAGRRRDVFRVAVATYLLAFPLALSWLNLALPRASIGYGFSGISMAFLGLLPLAIAFAVGARSTGTGAVDRSPGLFLAGLAVISWIALPASGVRALLALVSAVAAVAYLPGVPTAADLRDGARWVVATDRGGLVLVGLVAFLLIPFAAFPRTVASGTVVVNLYSHLLGYCLGFLVPYTTVQVARRLDRLGRPGATIRRFGVGRARRGPIPPEGLPEGD